MRKKIFSFGLGVALVCLIPIHATGQATNWTQAVTTSTRVSATAAGSSLAPSFSADGRSLMFLSRANNLVTNDNNRPWLDLFVHRLETGQILLASPDQAGTGGSEADVESPSISSNGSRVAFVSFANDITMPAGTNNQGRNFVRDLTTGQTTIANLSYDHQLASGGRGFPPAISLDGRMVLFQSTVAGLETNGPLSENSSFNYIYARDWQSNLIQFVSQSTNITGAVNQYAATPSMSADGNQVAFLGYIASFSTYPNRREIFIRNLQDGTTTCISRLIARVWPEWELVTNRFHSYQPKLTPDGRYVAFTTRFRIGEIWHFDRLTDSISLVVTNVPVSTSSSRPTPLLNLSDHGQVVVYDNGTNLFAWDARTGTNQMVDVSLDGVTPGNSIATHAALSSDGSKVAFVSDSTNLVPQTAGLTNGSYQIYLRDLTLGLTHLLSTNALGQFNGDYSACYPVLSPDGTLVAFDSDDDSLVTGDFNHDSDVFTKNLLTGELRLISQALAGTSSATALGSVYGPTISISRDARYLAFTATDGELVPGDTNGFRDAIVSDQQTGIKTLASVGTDGTPANLDVVAAIVSDDGRFVLFSSFSANLFSKQPPEVLPGINHLYLRDLQSNTTILVASNDAASKPALSPDGRYVAFASTATNLVDYVTITNGNNFLNVYLYDVQVRTNILVSLHPTVPDGGSGHSRNPRFSPDSRWLLFDSMARGLDADQPSASTSLLYLYELATRSNRLVATDDSANYAFDTDFDTNANWVAYVNSSMIAVHSVTGKTNWYSQSGFTWSASFYRPRLSGDGSLLAFSGRGYLGIANNGIFLWNGADRKTTVVADVGYGEDVRSYSLQFTPDGHFLIFQTVANLMSIDTNGVGDVYLYDVPRSNLVTLTSAMFEPPGKNASILPTLSRENRNLVFHSYASDLDANDFNGGGDWLTMTITSNLVESIARPIIAQQPASQTNVDGTTTELTVAVTSGANVFYQWWKDGAALTNSGRLTGANAATLRFSPLLATDNGGYSVVVSNAYGSQTSSVATLTVIHPPFALQGLTLGSGTNGPQMTFGLQSMPGRTYQLLARPDLATGEWQPEGIAISATGEVLWFNFDLGTNPQRYFKVQEGP